MGGPFPAAALSFACSSPLYTLAATVNSQDPSVHREELPSPGSLDLFQTRRYRFSPATMTVPAFDIRPGANQIRTVERRSNMIFEKNVDIPLADGGLCRCNVYRPLEPGRYPVIMTMGPYGKDIPYAQFHVKSFAEIPDEQKGDLSAWETPHPDVSPVFSTRFLSVCEALTFG